MSRDLQDLIRGVVAYGPDALSKAPGVKITERRLVSLDLVADHVGLPLERNAGKCSLSLKIICRAVFICA
jgi:hypothetical protein